jgi:HSP20 family protein
MAGFFEKLKKGMGVEIPEENEEKRAEEKPKPIPKKSLKKTKIEKKITEVPVEKKEITEKVGEELEKSPVAKTAKEKWFEPEGELAVDVFQTEGKIFIQAAIAGVKPENLDINLENDVLIIKGYREKPTEDFDSEKVNYLYQECYWGPFSRQIILSEEVDPSRVEALMKEGILTIKVPIIERKKKRKIEIRG